MKYFKIFKGYDFTRGKILDFVIYFRLYSQQCSANALPYQKSIPYFCFLCMSTWTE